MKAKKVILLFSIFLALIFSGCSHEAEVIQPNYVDVTVYEAKIERIEDIRRFSGKAESEDEVDVYSKIPGKVIKINYELGSKVKKGDILFEIDEEDLRRELEVLKKQLIQADASWDKEYRVTKSTYDLAKINYENLKKDFKSYKILHDEQGISDQDFQNIEDSYKNAQIEYEQAKRSFDIVSGISGGEVSEGLAYVNTLKSQIENLQKNMSDLRIESPIDGIVSRVYINKGERYHLEKPAFVISGNDSMEIEISIPEHIVNHIESGKKVDIEIDSIKENIIGTIEGISPLANSYTGTYPVKIAFKNNLKVKSGMFARVYLPIEEKKGIVIPRKSIIKEDGKTYVYLVSSEMRVTKSFVKTGVDDGINVEILSGVTRGDLVVNRGMEYLEDDDIVEIVKDWE